MIVVLVLFFHDAAVLGVVSSFALMHVSDVGMVTRLEGSRSCLLELHQWA